MELVLGIILGVIVTFLALYLTRKLRMAEEKQAQELHQNTLNERLLHEVAEQVRALKGTVHHPRNRSRYGTFIVVIIVFQFVSPTGLGTEIKPDYICDDYPSLTVITFQVATSFNYYFYYFTYHYNI